MSQTKLYGLYGASGQKGTKTKELTVKQEREIVKLIQK